MDVIKTEGLEFEIFYNWLNCPFAECCPEREKREETLIMHRCAFNPSIFKCKAYQNFTSQSEVKETIDIKYL